MTDNNDKTNDKSDGQSVRPIPDKIDRGRRRFISRGGVVLGATGLNAVVGNAPASTRAPAIRSRNTQLRLGFLPLTDSASLVVAAELGIFARYGLDVELIKEASWATIRDKVAYGALDAAQMLAGQPLAVELGIAPVKEPMQTSFSLDLNGNGITLGRALCEAVETHHPGWLDGEPPTADALKLEVEARRERHEKPLRFAMVSPFSRHNYELRYWLAAAGIDPDKDIDLVVVPPVQMVNHLGEGGIDGFCVGEPWNSIAVRSGIGCQVISSYEIWNNGPEKVLGTTREFARRNPETLRLVHMALIEASQWIDDVENRQQVAEIIAAPRYVNAPPSVVAITLNGHYARARNGQQQSLSDFTVFSRYAANFPWRSHGAWFVTQMYRWGQIEESVNIRSIVESVYRPDPYRHAAAELGHPYPLLDYKPEGTHSSVWQLKSASENIDMGPDRFFDDKRFDPGALVDYIRSFDLNHMKVSLAELETQNV